MSGGRLSLNARLGLATGIVLAAFLGITGVALERAFHDAGLSAVRERLQTQIYALLAAAEVDSEGRLSMPGDLPEARLSSAGSGLYARIVDEAGGELWRSRSLRDLGVDFPATLAPGRAAFAPVVADDGGALYALTFSVEWELEATRIRRFTFQVAETRAVLERQQARFRRSLWGWLGAAGVALLVVQGLVLRFGLAPLRRVAREVAAIQSGSRKGITPSQPRELAPLTDNLNALIHTSQSRLDRYRNALAELAHSLKTPLAVLAATLEGQSDPADLRRTVAEQSQRMHRTIEYQLQRAAASGRTPLAPAVEIAPVVERIVESLRKVYADKTLQMDVVVDAGCCFPGDEGDLAELLGNLLDNACKWAAGHLRLRAGMEKGSTGALLLIVEDDGPGVPEEQVDAILARGVRADADIPGHGIGLAVVHELVTEVYGGSVAILRSDLGGARVEVRVSRGDA